MEHPCANIVSYHYTSLQVLHIIVFGESLLNDAVTVVLYHMLEVSSVRELACTTVRFRFPTFVTTIAMP